MGKIMLKYHSYQRFEDRFDDRMTKRSDFASHGDVQMREFGENPRRAGTVCVRLPQTLKERWTRVRHWRDPRRWEQSRRSGQFHSASQETYFVE